METEVVNLRVEKHDIYIGRPSIWGNPFVIGRDGDRETVIRKYREYILNEPILLSKLPELRGKKLGCYCKPLLCHGDVLVEILNDYDKNKKIVDNKSYNAGLDTAIRLVEESGLDYVEMENLIFGLENSKIK